MSVATATPQQETLAIRPIPYDRTAEFLIIAQIIGATFLQKLAVPLGGGAEFFFGFFWMMGLTAYGFISKKLEVRKERFTLLMVMVGGMALSQLFGICRKIVRRVIPERRTGRRSGAHGRNLRQYIFRKQRQGTIQPASTAKRSPNGADLRDVGG